MAGLGFKDFQVGEVLTSADVDGYLMQQSVMRFADSGARGSALGTAVGTGVPLAEGMVAYLDDVNEVQIFDGTVWAPVGRVLAMGGTVVSGSISGTGLIPADNTIPQNTEGVEFMSFSYTPVRSDTRLLVQSYFSATEAANTSDVMSAALFQDSIADAIDARNTSEGDGGIEGFVTCFLTADVASTGAGTATTFAVRVGLNNASAILFNAVPARVNGHGSLGNVGKSSLFVTEYLL